MARTIRPVVEYNADIVWAAACTAQRINGSYIKYLPDTQGQTNRDIVDKCLEQPELIQECDRELGEKVRTYYKAFTFKILKGVKLSDFDNTAMTIANRDVITSKYDVAVICSLPASYERSTIRDAINQRIEFARGGLVGSVGDKVKLDNIEVLKSNFSQQYSVYFITGLTCDDQVVFFANKNSIDIGKKINIQGTVKAHRNNSTQLNRVKVI